MSSLFLGTYRPLNTVGVSLIMVGLGAPATELRHSFKSLLSYSDCTKNCEYDLHVV